MEDVWWQTEMEMCAGCGAELVETTLARSTAQSSGPLTCSLRPIAPGAHTCTSRPLMRPASLSTSSAWWRVTTLRASHELRAYLRGGGLRLKGGAINVRKGDLLAAAFRRHPCVRFNPPPYPDTNAHTHVTHIP